MIFEGFFLLFGGAGVAGRGISTACVGIKTTKEKEFPIIISFIDTGAFGDGH